MYISRRQQGFTIIEVMIVLVIAAVIMLIVFLAVPALQRNSRNTQRTNDAARIATLYNECITSRNGVTASCDTAAEINYNANEFGQLTTMNLSTTATAPTSNTTTAGVWINATCNASGSGATTGGNPRGAVVLFSLEPATTRCVSV
jgi:prepilin-type N-terminal cleavage/methylation domain-containing protein